MRYEQGEKVLLGDRVELWHRQTGTVVCVLDDNQFDSRFPASEWSYLRHGTLIETEDGNLFHYSELDEDFRFVSRG